MALVEPSDVNSGDIIYETLWNTQKSLLFDAIGNQIYTEGNYITTDESITTSLNAIDMKIKDIVDEAYTFNGAKTFNNAITLINTGLHILDTDASHDLIIAPGSNLTADRTLTLTTGDADRTITLNGNPTLNDWFDQSVKTNADVTVNKLITAEIVPGANLVFTQNSVAAVTFEETGAVVNTLYLKAGNVGIGTTGPNAQLESLATTEQLRLSYSAAVYSSFSTDAGGNLTISVTGAKVALPDALDVSGGITGTLQTAAQVNVTSVGTLTSLRTSGNVGIGTTGPNAQLESLATTEQLRLSYSAAVYSSFSIDTGGNLTISVTGAKVALPDALDVSGGITGTLQTAAQVNVTSLGTIAALRTSGTMASGGETAPDVDAGGLCLNHGASDGKVLTFKNSDVAHGVTSYAETDTYAEFGKSSATLGGLAIDGFGESGLAVALNGYYTTDVTTKSASATAAIMLGARKKSGTSVASMGANANILTLRNLNATTHIFDADGDSYQDVGTAWTNFDDHEDALAVRDCMRVLGNKKEQFKGFIKYNAQKLHDMKVITYTPKEKSSSGEDEMFLSNKGILGLYGGAIGELHGVLELALKKLGMDYDTARKQFRENQLLN